MYGTAAEGKGHLCSSLPVPPVHQHSDNYLQLYIEMTTNHFQLQRMKSPVSLLMIESCELWTLKPKLWTSQIWTLIHLVNNFVIVLLCVKSSKLITLEENIISVQQLLVCLPLFFVFSSEVLNSVIKSCFDGVVFQDAVCEECFSIRLRCFYL